MAAAIAGWKGGSSVNVTVSFKLTAAERRLSLRARSYMGTIRDSLIGLPIAAAGVVLVVLRLTPGAASGWGFILTVLGLAILAVPQVALIRGMLTRKARSLPDRVSITLSPACLRYAIEGYTAELSWRYVTDVKSAADCWLVTTRLGSSAIVIPRRAVPAESGPEVTELLSHWRDLAVR
jgi:hypothetical protein